MPTKRLGWAVAGVALTGALSLIAYFSSSTEISAPRKKQALSQSSSKPVVQSSEKFQVSEERMPVSKASLNRDLATSPNWRASALNALQHPELGGKFYARKIINECALITSPHSSSYLSDAVKGELQATGTVQSKALELRERMIRRCAGFTPAEIDSLHAGLSSKDSRAGDLFFDLLGGLQHGLRNHDEAQFDAAARGILATQDPLLFSDGGAAALRQIAGEGSTRPVYWFDGESYPMSDSAKATIYLNALSLAACSEAAFCDVDSEMTAACLRGSLCLDSREQFLAARSRWGGLTDVDFKESVELSKKMVVAIKQLDVSAFRPK